jgi:hypothetical protein
LLKGLGPANKPPSIGAAPCGGDIIFYSSYGYDKTTYLEVTAAIYYYSTALVDTLSFVFPAPAANLLFSLLVVASYVFTIGYELPLLFTTDFYY